MIAKQRRQQTKGRENQQPALWKRSERHRKKSCCALTHLILEGPPHIVWLLRDVEDLGECQALLVAARPGDLALGDAPQPAEAPENRRLAGAVVACEQEGLPLLEGESQALDQHHVGLPPSRVGQHVATGIATERSATTRLQDSPV